MTIFIFILGIILLGGGIALTALYFWKKDNYNDGLEDEAPKKKLLRLGVIVIVVAFAVMIFSGSFAIVPTGYTGVRTTFGQVSQNTMRQGFNWKIPVVEKITLVNNKQQDMRSSHDIWGETSEKTPVFATDIVVTYQISRERSAWLYANVTDVKELVDNNILASAVKSAMVELPAERVTNRSAIEPLAQRYLQASLDNKYGASTITVLKVVVNQMDFEASYNDAIAARSIARQNYEKQQIENNTAISKAEAEKQVQITNAEAKAEALLIEARAQADANKILNESLTDKVLRARFYEKWDGKLPTVMGQNTTITAIDIPMEE